LTVIAETKWAVFLPHSVVVQNTDRQKERLTDREIHRLRQIFSQMANQTIKPTQ